MNRSGYMNRWQKRLDVQKTGVLKKNKSLKAETWLSGIRKKECVRKIFFKILEAAQFAERGRQPN